MGRDFAVRPFQPVDAFFIARERQGLAFDQAVEVMREIVGWAARGEAVTAYDLETGEPGYIAGIYLLGGGEAQTWSHHGPHPMRDYQRAVGTGPIRACRRQLREWVARFRLRRVISVHPKDAPELEHRFIRALGLRPVGEREHSRLGPCVVYERRFDHEEE